MALRKATARTQAPPALAEHSLEAVGAAMRRGDIKVAYEAARSTGAAGYSRAMAAVDALVEGHPLDEALALLAPAPDLPALPIDLARAGWAWETSPAGTVRLALAGEGLATLYWPPPATASAITEARRIAAEEAQRDAAAIRELGGAAPATPWQPGPDAGGVYRRPPWMAERILAAPRELVDGRWQPRETYDEATLAELAESIRAHGVIADLLAIVNEYGELELIAGHRRKRAALVAGGRDVPVKVLEVTAAQAFELAIIDNDQRSDLTDLERGRAYERIIAEQQISEAELARRLGRARAYIQQRRKLAQACPELQQAYISGQLGFTHVRAICDGSGGDHAVQQAVVAYALKEIKAGRPDTATYLQERAERTVREQSGAALKSLGWMLCQFWQGNTQRHYYHAPTARPAEWSSAEILAAVREQRRPPDGAAAAPLDSAARLDLERHGWKVSATACAPWTIAEKGKELIVGDAGDLAPQIAAAREMLQKLADRFARAGWAATWNHTTLTATPPEGGGS